MGGRRDSEAETSGVRPKRKALEQAHMVDHVLASINSAYADFRFPASKVVVKRHLFHTTSKEVGPVAKVAKTDDQKLAGIHDCVNHS